MDITGDSGRLLGKLMSAASRRADVIANNIANQSTPGFKRGTLAFEELLASEMKRGGADLLSILPERQTDFITASKANGNNVQMELEVNAMNENRLLYETYAAIMAGRMELVRASIDERG